MGFSQKKWVYLRKSGFISEKVGFSQKKGVFSDKVGFHRKSGFISEKVGLSENVDFSQMKSVCLYFDGAKRPICHFLKLVGVVLEYFLKLGVRNMSKWTSMFLVC